MMMLKLSNNMKQIQTNLEKYPRLRKGAEVWIKFCFEQFRKLHYCQLCQEIQYLKGSDFGKVYDDLRL